MHYGHYPFGWHHHGWQDEWDDGYYWHPHYYGHYSGSPFLFPFFDPQHLYNEFFFGLSGNEKIERGLRYVASAQSRCSPLVKDMASTVLDEMATFQYRRYHPLMLRAHAPHRHPPSQTGEQVQQPTVRVNQSAYKDPLLEELAQVALKEIAFHRGERECEYCCIYFAIALAIAIIICFIIAISLWSTA